ncbi:MAG TPA: HEPN domain-containing protein [Methylophilus sp.]|nr:HEPN domain-containing protein [Methylophilus sp.]HQQ33460.1 HEPN domain-containing protein [Methylophilus sp.]
MNKEILINNFAIRCFRDVADYDYISARMAYRAKLVPQFLWSSLQAIEKYLKCILLLNRIEAKDVGHDLSSALDLLKKHAPFELRLQKPSRDLIGHLDTYGRFRYLETPFHVMGLEIMQLDMAVWDIRRYCRALNYEISLLNGEKKQMLEIEIKTIEHSENKPPHTFHIIGGALEGIIANKAHPAREPLLWQNLFFGMRVRKSARLQRYMQSTNSPLSLHPEILEDILKFVHLPKDAVNAYRRELERKVRVD